MRASSTRTCPALTFGKPGQVSAQPGADLVGVRMADLVEDLQGACPGLAGGGVAPGVAAG
jgi:hypothetical protein